MVTSQDSLAPAPSAPLPGACSGPPPPTCMTGFDQKKEPSESSARDPFPSFLPNLGREKKMKEKEREERERKKERKKERKRELYVIFLCFLSFSYGFLSTPNDFS